MREKPFLLHYYLLAGLIGTVAGASSVDAAVRISNQSRSYSGAYNEINNIRQQAQYVQGTPSAAPTVDDLPVRVANNDLAEKITHGDASAGVNMDDLDACSRLYPDGEFEWARPTIGAHAGGSPTCVAVVEMRGIHMAADGGDAVLARVRLAAGDTITCNISQFPESSYLNAVGDVVFPADNAPTMDDVVAVMNQEQKQNAGIKIAAGAVAFGLAGNIAGKNEPGKDSLLGKNKEKLGTTAIGALTGAALMAGNSYAGKMGGDIILSTGINAAAGGLVGNMAATGDGVLRIEKCKLPDGKTSTCLWGVVSFGEDISGKDGKAYFYNLNDQTTLVCDVPQTGNAPYTDCKSERLTSIVLDAYGTKQGDLETHIKSGFNDIGEDYKYHLEDGKMQSGSGGSTDIYTPIKSATTISKQVQAMLSDVSDKSFGWKKSEWSKIRSNIDKDAKIYGRTNQGDAYALTEEVTLDKFIPMVQGAEDGGLIDLDNKARAKDTLIGAGAGGALGAFTAYQGAQDDIQNRWATATQEYKDSLQKIYCATGRRFLSYYNKTLDIPKLEQE